MSGSGNRRAATTRAGGVRIAEADPRSGGRTLGCRLTGSGEGLLEPSPALAQMVAHVPERPDPGEQTDADFRVAQGQDKPKVLGLSVPRGFGLNIFGTVQSGKAYTPQDVDGNATGRVYSKNGPIEAVFNLRLNQEVKLGKSNTLNA